MEPGKVLVTGGTVRLGLAIASRLRERGWRVFTASHRADAGADYTVDFRGEWTLPQFDAIVNNAALFTGDARDIETVNFIAPMRIISEKLAPNIVNVLDSRVLGLAREPIDPYAGSKWRLWRETIKFHPGMRVNGVAPGPVIPPVAKHERAGITPLGKPTPEAVAEAVAFMLEAEYVSGAVIPVDGGQHLL